jgi:hypothetical protein
MLEVLNEYIPRATELRNKRLQQLIQWLTDRLLATFVGRFDGRNVGRRVGRFSVIKTIVRKPAP